MAGGAREAARARDRAQVIRLARRAVISEVDNIEEASAIVREAEYPPIAVRRIAEACKANGKLARGSAETEEYWQLGCNVLNLPGTDVSTYLDWLKAWAGRPQARPKAIGMAVR